MKILVITDLYPIKEDEVYTPRTIYNFVQSWRKLGCDVKIIKPNFLLNSFLRKKPFYKSGVYGQVENINYFSPFFGNVKEKITTSFTPDIVIAHMPSGLIFANKLGLPFVAGVHVSDLEVLTNPLYSIYFKAEVEKAYQNALKIACRSEVLRQKFLKLYPQFEDKTFVAPSGISCEIIQKIWQNNERIKVLTCGQFIKRKNIDKVIEACDKFENIDLTVIGSGKLEKKLKKISKKPIFTGNIPHSEVLAKMRESDIFILPSINETFGMVYLEAMASGCITVCTKDDGVAGIIKDEVNGFLTEPDKLAEAIKQILNRDDLDSILENAYQTVSGLTGEKAATNYLDNITNA